VFGGTLAAAGALVGALALPAGAHAQTLELLVYASEPEARTAWQNGAYDDALSALQGDDAPSARALRALVLAETGEYDDAIRAVGGAAGPAPTPSLERLRGELLLRVGRRDAARSAFEAAEAGSPDEAAVARLRLAEMAMYTADRDAAFDVFDSFIDDYNGGRANSADELIAVGAAVAYLARTNPGLMQDALRAFDEAAAISPNYPAPRIALGDLFRTTYQTPDAYEEYAAVLGRNPGHPDALLGRARAQHFDGNPEAMLTARRALETNPNHPDALAFVARLTLEAEGSREARELAEDALDVDPTNLEALSVLAATYFLDEELAAFDGVVARLDAFAPAYGGLHGLVAEMAVSHRKYAEAVELGRTALARDPGLHAVRGRMGMTMLRLGDLESGRREVERAFEGDPFNPWFKNTLDLADTWAEFTTLETEHFEIFLPTAEADLLGPLLEETAEAAWDGLVARYAYEPRTPVRVELYPSSADFSVRALGLAGLGALGVSFGPVLVMDSPSARPAGEFNWRSVLWHELAHTFHLEFTEHEVPRWFSEGLAMREQRVEDDRWGFKPSVTFFQAYDAGDMPALSNLTEGLVRPRFPGQVGLTYLQASYVFDWIEGSWGFETVRAFLEGYRDDRTTEQLVDDLLGMSMEEADEAFDLYLRDRFEREFASTAGERDDEAMEDAAGGNLLFGDRTDEASIRLLRNAVEAFPESFRFRLALGQTLLGAGRLDEAETELREALRLFPAFPEEGGPLWGLAEIHEQRGETREAADALRRLGYLGETQWAAPRREAELRRELGDLEGEIDALRRAAEVFPFERDLQLRRAEVAEAAGDATEWVRARRAVLALDPVDRAEAHFQLARALRAADRSSEARTQVLRALEIAPTFEAALELLLELRGST
jgi:tetratricopeptide (TPR) repeat protein